MVVFSEVVRVCWLVDCILNEVLGGGLYSQRGVGGVVYSQ